MSWMMRARLWWLLDMLGFTPLLQHEAGVVGLKYHHFSKDLG